MGRYGSTAYGDNLYRIVFSNSRHYIVAGDWSATHVDENGKVHLNLDSTGTPIQSGTHASEVPLYPEKPDVWVLERWLPALEFAGCSKETWDWQYECLGPYPERGDYQGVHFFEACSPANASIDKLVMWIEQGRKNSWQTILDGCKDAHEAKKKAERDQNYDRVYDKLSAHLDNAMVGPYATRGTKTVELKKTARQAGMRSQFNHAPGAETAPGMHCKFGIGKDRRKKVIAA